MWWSPVFQIAGGEDVRKRRYVRIHQHDAEQYASGELVAAHAQRDQHVVDVHHHLGTMAAGNTVKISADVIALCPAFGGRGGSAFRKNAVTQNE